MASSSWDRGHAGRGAETDWEAITESEMKERGAKLATGATAHNSEATANEVEVEGGSACLHSASPENESIGLDMNKKTQ